MIFINYPKCSTCKKAKEFLINNNIEFFDRHIIENNPTKDELAKWIKMSGKSITKFINTSGLLYKELKLKDKIKDMSEGEILDIISSNGMLVKRPILVLDDDVLTGFKIDEWNKIIK